MCPACGRKLDIGVCAGPHPGYRLRTVGGGVKSYVQLPEWWHVVTTTPVSWSIRYDPMARLREQKEQERREKERLREKKERGAELRELLRLANKLGYDVREKQPAWALV